MSRSASACIAIAATLLCGEARSQGLVPLSETVNADTEKSYAIVRCAALYTATVEWGGQKLGRETYEGLKAAVDSLLLTASLVRLEHSNDPIEHVSNVVMLDAREVADLNLENFRASYASTGNAWEGNPVWTGDLAFCEPIAQAARDVVKSVGE